MSIKVSFTAFLSGFCLLAMEALWIRRVTLSAGVSLLAFSGVVTALFLSGALGAWLLPRLPEWTRNHTRWLWPLWGLSAAACSVVPVTLESWEPGILTGSFFLAMLLCGLPGLFAGMTLPLILSLPHPAPDQRTRRSAGFYTWHLLGSALGALAGGVAPLADIGFRSLFWTLCVLTVLPACWMKDTQSPPRRKTPSKPAQIGLRGLSVLVISGFGIMSMQVILFAYLRLSIPASFYAAPALLIAFLLGMGLGSWRAARLRRRGVTAQQALWRSALGTVCTLLIVRLGLNEFLAHPFVADADPWTHLLRVLAWTTLFSFPVLLFAGSIYPCAWELCFPSGGGSRKVFGTVSALSGLSGALGMLSTSLLILPALGPERSFALLTGFYVLIGCFQARPGQRKLTAVLSLTILGGLLRLPAPGLPLQEKHTLLHRRFGGGELVTVVETTTPSRKIILNHTYTLNGTASAVLHQRNQSLLPMMFRNADRPRVLFIGMASGLSAAAALELPIEELWSVELNPEVVRSAREYFSEWNSALFTHPASRVLSQDGRVVTARHPEYFDLVICDLFHPGLDGAERMYSLEFFQSVSQSLRPGGQFALWLPFHQLNPEGTGIILRTFLDVFPNAMMIRANTDPRMPVMGIVGSHQPIDVSDTRLTARWREAVNANAHRENPFLRKVENLRCTLVLDLRKEAARFAEYPLTTEDHPRLVRVLGGRDLAGDQLISFRVLEWIGRDPVQQPLPSLRIPDAEVPQQLAAFRAGNYLYASATSGFLAMIAPDAAAQFRQSVQSDRHLQTARVLLPEVEINSEDLGR